ncbi:MAG: hypothetical protein LBG80_11640 [Bacteroidales bacterium]|jgi:hypothetical protein|nr:hypothetical protein [Bacteroidales bacterium]
MEIQKILFEIIKQRLPANLRLADIIGEILNIGTDSVYRRIRGETELTITELSKLCIHFNISMDAILNYSPNDIMLKYSPLYTNNIDNYYKYIEDFASLLENMVKSGGNKEIIIMSQDIATVHFYPYLELILFKIYTWFKSFNNFQLTYDKFVETLNLERVSGFYKKITEAYLQIPSSEIWTTKTIRPFLYLLHYYSDLNCFENKDTINIIVNQLIDLLKNIESCTEKGEKKYIGKPVSFRMYLSPIDFSNNYMIIRRDRVNMISIKLHAINSVFTSDSCFYSEINKLIEDMTCQSLLLSGTSARERFLFFQKLKSEITLSAIATTIFESD